MTEMGRRRLPVAPNRTDADVGTTMRSVRAETWQRFRRHKLAVVSLGLLAVMAASVVFGPILLPFGPETVDLSAKDEPPSIGHPMGTDELGRDQLARVLDGGRLTLAVAGSAVLVSMVLGMAVGVVSGWAGGLVDSFAMRTVDVFYCLPSLFVVILLVSVFGASFWTIVVSIALFSWMNTARLVRASFLSLKQKEFVEALRCMGMTGRRIVLRHILPNALGPVIVAATLGIAGAILTESALSFLGLGFDPPKATWGGMLEESRRALITLGQWWRGLFPGLMIFFVVLAVNFLGDGLRDALDPRARGGRA